MVGGVVVVVVANVVGVLVGDPRDYCWNCCCGCSVGCPSSSSCCCCCFGGVGVGVGAGAGGSDGVGLSLTIMSAAGDDSQAGSTLADPKD